MKDIFSVIVTRGILGFLEEKMTIDIGRPESISVLEQIKNTDDPFVIVSQKDPIPQKITKRNLYKYGVKVKLDRVKKIDKDYYQADITIIGFVKVLEFLETSPIVVASVEERDNQFNNVQMERELVKKLQELVSYEKLNKKQLKIIEAGTNAAVIVDIFASTADFELEEKVAFIKERNVNKRMLKLLESFKTAEQLKKIDEEIERQIQESFNQNQKEYYLREKIKAIKEELGDKDNKEQYVTNIRESLNKNPYPEHIKAKILDELNKYEMTSNQGSDANVIRSYLDWMISLPWFEKTTEKLDLANAKEVLDQDHYGMEKVKDRILEYLAVKQLKNNYHGSIICLVGPPGVGKTSLAASIAKALNRNFVKIALGGVKDESEVRGHRRTYLGALPGRIIQGMKKAKSVNPVFLLDEIEKMGMDYKGDPSAAFLEVLDPEQNKFFSDHYIEEPYDLSQVMFIATANDISLIPGPLRDRMEIIELGGYTNLEKIAIATRYIIPKQIKEHGLSEYNINITKDAIEMVIDNYTMEAGVRGLEKQISKILRKIAKELLLQPKEANLTITGELVEKYLGKKLITNRSKFTKDQVGVVSGLAYTSFGGDVLPIEVTSYPGKGQLILTGRLGDVMKESAQIAHSLVKSRYPEKANFFKENDIHIHAPEGAIPKDGPSAGITITTAITSLITNQKVNRNIGMTGEINLRGNVMPIGGLKEKSLGAYRAGLKTIIVPHENEKDIEDIPQEIRKKLEVVTVKTIDDVLKLALV